jgi:anti-sigma regulatory factor (Ser/Thr protein kinase)
MSTAQNDYITLSFPARLNYMKAIREAIAQAASDFGFSEDDNSQIVMAVDEAAANCIQHGNALDNEADPRVYLQVYISRQRLVVELADESERFSPLEAPKIEIEEFLKSGENHGFGLYVINTFMDRIEHEFEEGRGNRLRLIKVLPVKSDN